MDLYKIYTKHVTVFRSLFLLLPAVISLTLCALPSTAYAGLTLYTTPNEAQLHCPNDEVVWLNLPTGVWHTKWQRWYGQTKQGAYVCRDEAAAAGNRASQNG